MLTNIDKRTRLVKSTKKPRRGERHKTPWASCLVRRKEVNFLLIADSLIHYPAMKN